MDKYSISIQWSDEDEGYIAIIPELKGLSAFGSSKEEALDELQIAKKAYLEVFEEDGCDLPGPDLLNNYSGQFRLRLPKSLHAIYSQKAERENVSLNTLIINVLSQNSSNESIIAELRELKNEIKRLHVLTDYFFQKEVSASCDIYDPKKSSVFLNHGQNSVAFIATPNFE